MKSNQYRIKLISEYILIYAILILIIPFSYLFARSGNYTYSFPVIIVSIIYILSNHTNTSRKKPFINKIILTFLVLTVLTSYSFFTYNLRYTSYLLFLSNAIIPFVIYFVFYTYSSREREKTNLLIYYFIIYYIIALYYIYYQQSIRLSEMLQLNNFYFVITPLPFLFLIEKPLFRTIVLALSTICVIISLKRSGFFIISLLSFYTAIFYFFSKEKSIRKILFIIFFIIIGSFAYHYMESFDFNYYERLTERVESIDDDRGSGRLDYAEKSIDRIQNMNVLQLLIGKGFSAIDSEQPRQTGYHSFHNDYSEAAYSYGFVGLFCFLVLVFHCLKNCIKLHKAHSPYSFSVVTSFIILIVFSFSSSVMHYTFYMLPLFMFWGYIEPKIERIKG